MKARIQHRAHYTGTKLILICWVALTTAGVSTCSQKDSTDQSSDGTDTSGTDTAQDDSNDTNEAGTSAYSGASSSLPDCQSDGQVDCVVRRSSRFRAVSLDQLIPEKLRSGLTVAGVVGMLADCADDGSSGCVATSSYRAAEVASLAGKVTAGSTVAGIAGSYMPPPMQVTTVNGAGSASSPPSCSGDGQIGCLTVTGYPSVRLANISGTVVRSGTTVGGIAGSLQSCVLDGQTNCVTTSSIRAANVSNLSPWNVRYGTSVAGITGALKTNCRNTVDSSKYNFDGSVTILPTTTSSSGTALDFWDTIDDYYGFPSSRVTAWSNGTFCDPSLWLNTTTTDGGSSIVACGTSSTCIAKDMISNLEVTGILASSGNTTSTTTPGQFPWNTAVNKCATSTYGGYPAGTWRLPTQKEMMTVYLHGIAGIAGYNFMNQAHMTTGMWSSSSYSIFGTSAWTVAVGFGTTVTQSKTAPLPIFCVR